jgi:hypothetical protein
MRASTLHHLLSVASIKDKAPDHTVSIWVSSLLSPPWKREVTLHMPSLDNGPHHYLEFLRMGDEASQID